MTKGGDPMMQLLTMQLAKERELAQTNLELVELRAKSHLEAVERDVQARIEAMERDAKARVAAAERATEEARAESGRQVEAMQQAFARQAEVMREDMGEFQRAIWDKAEQQESGSRQNLVAECARRPGLGHRPRGVVGCSGTGGWQERQSGAPLQGRGGSSMLGERTGGWQERQSNAMERADIAATATAATVEGIRTSAAQVEAEFGRAQDTRLRHYWGDGPAGKGKAGERSLERRRLGREYLDRPSEFKEFPEWEPNVFWGLRHEGICPACCETGHDASSCESRRATEFKRLREDMYVHRKEVQRAKQAARETWGSNRRAGEEARRQRLENGVRRLASKANAMEAFEDFEGNPARQVSSEQKALSQMLDDNSSFVDFLYEQCCTDGDHHRAWAWVDCLDRGGDPHDEGLSIEGIIRVEGIIRGPDVGNLSGGELGAADEESIRSLSEDELGNADEETLRSEQSASEEWATSGDDARESEEPSGDEVSSQGASSVEEDAEEESSAGEESD